LISRRFLAWWAGWLAALGGCTVMAGGLGCNGIVIPPKHPSLRLQSVQIAPAGPVHPGQEITVTATSNRPSSDCTVKFMASTHWGSTYPSYLPQQDWLVKDFELRLRDDGKGGDQYAHDGVWFRRYKIPPGADCTMQACAVMSFRHRFGQPAYGRQVLQAPDIVVSAPAPEGKPDAGTVATPGQGR
jgi:hypothetical protein